MITTSSLFTNAILVLLLLVWVNCWLRRHAPRLELSRAELLLVYSMVCIGSAVSGLDLTPTLVQMMAEPYRASASGNTWLPLFGRYLPTWLLVTDRAALDGYFRGGTTLYKYENYGPWLMPCIWWTGCLVALLFVMMCINILVRVHWTKRERLTFPITQLPLIMTEPGSDVWKDRMLWAGFGIAAGIITVNSLSQLLPAIPPIPMGSPDISASITAKPWNAIGWTPCTLQFYALGLGFLLPIDLLFSCWFFYIAAKMQLVVTSAMAWDVDPQAPFLKQQSFGGYMGVVVMLVWSGRNHLRSIWQSILGSQSGSDDAAEAMSYRSAAFGAIGGTALLVCFFHRAGLSPLIALAALVIYFALSIAITRMRAELGPPVHDLYLMGPQVMLPQIVGVQSLSANNLTALTWFEWFNRSYRGHPMAVGLESLRMGQVARANQRQFLIAVMVAGVIGAISTFWVYLAKSYALGNSVGFHPYSQLGAEPFVRLQSWLSAPSAANPTANTAVGLGFIFVILLGLLRLQFVMWPFHPIGFALASDWSMNHAWCSLFIAWCLKAMILRFGGLKLLKRSMPFFYGLVLGQMTAVSVWSLIGLATGVRL